MDALSASLGIPLSTFKLLGTIILAYPVALVYRTFYLNPTEAKGEVQRNLYVITTGLALSLFFSGKDIIHSLITVTFTWTACKLLEKQRALAVAICFLFNMIYLLGGYYSNSLETYDITWTMPQCILCLRMIGLSWDFYDGRHESTSKVEQNPPKDKEPDSTPRSPTVKQPSNTPASFIDAALPTLPPYLEVLGYSYFFGAFLIGPQFSFSLYKRFLNLQPQPKDNHSLPDGAYTRTLRCIGVGVFYLALQQLIGSHYPMLFTTTTKYAQLPFLDKFIYMWIAGKFGTGVLCGISFNGYDEAGNPRWDCLANVDIYKYETATSLTQIIESFNMNTSIWSKLYVFKRLKFMGNKNLSTFFTLLFLAIWHGVHAGYFLCFATEFIDVIGERIGAQLLAPYVQWMYVSNSRSTKAALCRQAHKLFTWFLTTSALHYAVVPLELLLMRETLVAWSHVYFFGTFAIFGLIALGSVKSQLVKRERSAIKKIN
ncbi:MBOAT-domain-containing protein [Basidiobolus meristosporus CBS 931.73]|uniref:Lysophospholipid acyltransferase 5 n=1 Tax=Basidiobolus meristosporus CBS 931.73 TaxID=1314790 RepID=A0A1Y1XUE7_9FUNG|nr:MBOAT-domain-containing protein [Basidiobolus meristosporus CBS 931.73]|eukprot:ORX89305.1 MBOAT-domain-containing protein [Basidiobolus meristosporus CBS 931.73]